MTSRREDRDGPQRHFCVEKGTRETGLFIDWLQIHARTLVHSHDCVTSVLSTRSHRCALSKPYFRLVARANLGSDGENRPWQCEIVNTGDSVTYDTGRHTRRHQHR